MPKVRNLAALLGSHHAFHHMRANRLLMLAFASHEARRAILVIVRHVGRMLIPLFLWQRGRIERPTFNVSTYFEAHRNIYYQMPLAGSRDDDWRGWCIFFLQAVKHQAEYESTKIRSILDLHDGLKRRMDNATRSRHAIRTLDWVSQKPIFSSTSLARGTNIPVPSAHRILADLQAHGILERWKSARGSRPAFFVFPELLDILEA